MVKDTNTLRTYALVLPGVVVIVLGLLLATGSVFGLAQGASPEVKIGVLANRGPEKALKEWGATAKYLRKNIPGHAFVIVPLHFDEIVPAVRDGRVDFMIANPSIYVELEALYGATRIATMRKHGPGRSGTQFGGVIICRSDRDDIHNLSDIKGKSFLAVDETSLGGWQMAWYEFHLQGIDPYKDFRSLTFSSTHDSVIYAVRDGKIDAGTARADTLGQLAQERKVDISKFRILNQRADPDYPYLSSTALYPEWPVARLRNTDDEVAQQVVIHLLEMRSDSAAAQDAGILGWTTPLNYTPVHDLMRELRLGPYKDYGKITAAMVMRKYRYAVAGVAAAVCILLGFTVLVLRLNRVLRTSRKAAEDLEQQLDLILNSAGDGIFGLDDQGRHTFINSAGAEMLGFRPEELIGSPSHETWHHTGKDGLHFPKERCPVYSVYRDGKTHIEADDLFWRKDGKSFPAEYICTPIIDNGKVTGAVVVFKDITRRKEIEQKIHEKNRELDKAYKELQSAQSTILQQEKMASIGQLAAGVAHEINNPTGFIMSNLGSLNKFVEKLKEFLRVEGDAVAGLPPERIAEVSRQRIALKVDYILDDMPGLIKESLEGADRIKKIVQDLKSFSRVDEAGLKMADINAGIESTINIVWNELKYKATVVKEFGNIPQIKCNPGKLNQVFMNLLVNAAHAIEKQGEIRIRTAFHNGTITVTIADTGCGIAADKLDRIFEPFFTSKDVGKGTGLGLSIAYDIVKKHNGTISVESEVGKGTTFTVAIPVVAENESALLPGAKS